MTPGMWTVSIAFTVASIIGLALNLVPAYRGSRVRTLGTSVGLAVPDSLATVLSSRLTRRSVITWLGSVAGLATKPQQQFLRRLWPDVAAAQPVKAA